MQVTRDQLARALREIEQAARTFQTQATRVEPSDPAGIAKHINAIAKSDAELTSSIGEAQALLRQLNQDDGDRQTLRDNFAAQGEGI